MTNQQRALLALRTAKRQGEGWVRNWELIQAGAGTQVNARLLELRRKGYEIICKKFGEVGKADWRYRLVREPEAFPAEADGQLRMLA
mgnify:CR=1 FL=1